MQESQPSGNSASSSKAGISIEDAMSILSSRAKSEGEQDALKAATPEMRALGQTLDLMNSQTWTRSGESVPNCCISDEGGQQNDVTKTSSSIEESESKVVQEAKNDKMKEELSKSTPKDLLSKLFELQQSRVEVYKQFNSGLDNVLQSGNLTTYPDLTANITASFSVISNSIRCIIEIMQSHTDGSRSKEFQLEEVDLSTLSNCIKFTKQLQNLEREKLNYTAALHLEKIRERNERLNIEARESGDEKVLNLLQQGVKGLQSKISGCIEQINETLEELRYASFDLQG
ncbi:hypothetical protein CTEN210_15298 [Chaetoceros tenuissimus]|uniref:Uncharacterized protein n=1 Tax=Chaetoceros tenuissimus TaxID=426638 RepID=A0AAD3D7D8_9STRA|nr:hypothetical protein CTEN210_15298 [Chaetoceros tenuissimus]